MQLIQIGQTPAKTILQLIEEMSASQFAEVERLKQSALERQSAAQRRRTSTARPQRVRCIRPSARMVKRSLSR
jgi:membrane protein involved in colicin uptake